MGNTKIHQPPTWVPKWLQYRPWGAQGPLLEASSFLDPFWERFWLPFALQFGSLWASIFASILTSFLGTLRERPRKALGRIWVPFWLDFGSILGIFLAHFLGSLAKVKVELSPRRGPHFDCPRGSQKKAFFFPAFFLHSLREASGAPSWSHFWRSWVDLQ